MLEANFNNFDHPWTFPGERRDRKGAISAAKMTSKPPDLQNDLRAPQNRLRASSYISEPPPFCLHAPHIGLH